MIINLITLRYCTSNNKLNLSLSMTVTLFLLCAKKIAEANPILLSKKLPQSFDIKYLIFPPFIKYLLHNTIYHLI